MTLKMKWWQLLISLALCFITAALVFMWFDTTPPLEFDASQSRITTQNAENGMMGIRVDWKVKVNRLCDGTHIKELFDPITKARLAVYLPEPASDRDAFKGDDHLIRTFLLPRRRFENGLIGYRSHLLYRCNWLQDFFPIQIDSPDLFFELTDHVDQ